MNVTKTELDGVVIIEPRVFGDHRGYFFESYNKQNYISVGINVDFIQDNESMSSYGVLRGLHYQLAPYAQSKLVRVVEGKVLDVAVDIRKNSNTFGKHVAVELSAENKRQLFIPQGFAHGFVVLSEKAIFSYKCDNYYNPENERGIIFNDLDINVDWQIPHNDVKLSEKDLKLPSLKGADIR